VSNHAYAGFWVRDPSQELLLDRFERFLESMPLSSTRPGYASLMVRAVSPAETPLAEYYFAGNTGTPADVVTAAREHVHDDVEYEVSGFWDLWRLDLETGRWVNGPEQVHLIARGSAYDDGLSTQTGDFAADLGFENLFTGHGGLLGLREGESAPAGLNGAGSDAAEAEFLALINSEPRLREYQDKTRQNIQQLFGWLRAVQKALPIERDQLWSEGEENLEARLDEILADH
jgi:hypothetical protein